MRPTIRKVAAAVQAASLIAGCASLEGASTHLVADRRVEYVVAGHGAPAVVFENGLGGALDWWAKVFPQVAKDTTAFAYDRPGYGASDPASSPRDGGHIVDELRVLLRSNGIAPPYVLVGHSLGGLYMQLYARRYPDEVAGLVLVDSTHPEQLKGAGSPENWPAWFRVLFGAATSVVAKEELNATTATGEALLALPPFIGKPVMVLSAAAPIEEDSELARDAAAKRKDIARLNPGSWQIWVDSGHAIPLEKPEAVIAAIREVLRLVRAGSPSGVEFDHRLPTRPQRPG